MSTDRIWGGERIVLYLPAATQTLADIDGSREQEITQTIEKFLDAPRTAWDKHPRDHVWQVRDLGTNTRAFATWCQNHDLGCEAFIVQEIYRKTNEDEYWADIAGYDDAGEEYIDMFEGLSQAEFDEWVGSLPERDGFRLVKPE